MPDPMTRNSPSLDAEQIIDWLHDNPAFFQQHPEVLDHVLPPKEKTGKGVADFQYYMLQRLKADRDEVVETTRDVIQTSRMNMNMQARFHTAVLMLLDARHFEDFVRTMTMDFAAILDVDIVSLAVETDGGSVPHIEITGVRGVHPGTIGVVTHGKHILLESDILGFEDIYGGGATLVKSQALITLNIAPGSPPVLLAFGSRNPAMFLEGQGTELLIFLGRVVERCFRQWLDLL